MNILDYIILGIIALYVLNGVYRGFSTSVLNMGGTFLAWIISVVAYPLLSKLLVTSELFSSMRFYIEGAERVGDAFELTKLNVANISDAQLSHIMEEYAKLPAPFDTAVVSNVTNQSFAEKGLVTLGEYFDETIYCVMINIVSIIIIFLAVRIILTLLTNAYSFSFSLPQLRRFDRVIGGGIGLIRGFFEMYMLFALVPIALIFMPIPQMSNLVNNSLACEVFYSSGILLPFVGGVI